MAKVKKFRDRRKKNQVSIHGRSQSHSNSVEQPDTSADAQNSRLPTEGGGQDVATTEPIREDVSDPASTKPLVQPTRCLIQVPGVEDLMIRAQRRVGPARSRMSALTASLEQPYQIYRPLFRPHIHLSTGLPVTGWSTSGSAPIYFLHGTAPNPPRPTDVELAGYAGLEDLPILRAMMEHPEINKMHTFYFRFNDVNCPAAVLLVDPLPGMGKGKYAEHERNCWNAGHEAWLYVRRRGDVKWRRDFMAERGGMRHAVYLSRCEDGWMWEQQLGDLLDCRKSLNLWIKVKA